MKRTIVLVLALIAAGFIASIVLYPQLPEQVASHWNAAGEVNDYLPKFWGAFLMPIVALATLGLFLLIPRIDPLRRNIATFRPYFNRFIVVITAFFLYIHILSLLWNIGIQFDFSLLILPAFAGLIYYAGVLIGKSERNWFIGIRTPWTLMSDEVWKDTHRVGALCFKISAGIALLGMLIPRYGFYLALIPVLCSAAFVIIYSYAKYGRLAKEKQRDMMNDV